MRIQKGILLFLLPAAAAQQTAPAAEEALFEKLPVVQAASLHEQSLEEAPANVTVITAVDILKYGYRTLGEALASVRGFYLSSDRMYGYVGVRGLSLPGDYNTRFLVMLNGHPLTDNVYASNSYFGQDFGLDMDLVERIEVIRGPTSALYGSNGILANINVITRSPVDSQKWRASTEIDSFGVHKGIVSAAPYLGKGVNLLLSAAVFNNSGQDLYVPELDSPDSNNGWARGADGERGYHTFANLVWRDWSFTAYFNSREKQVPVAWDTSALFGDPGAHVLDRRGLIGAAYKHRLQSGAEMQWQLFYNSYRYDDRFDYSQDSILQDYRSIARGDWVDTQFTYTFPTGRSGALTLGAQAAFEFRNLQSNYIRSPIPEQLLEVSVPNRLGAMFAQQEWKLSKRWTVYGGFRLDASSNFGNNVSPRIAVVYEPGAKTVWKFIYGRPFRNPSSYEQFYYDGLMLLRPQPLRSETAHTFEASLERKLTPNWTIAAAAYHYRLSDMIAVLTPDGIPPGTFVNAGRIGATGVEAEVTGKLFKRVELSGSCAFQRAREHGAAADLPNSPHQLHKGRAGLPLARGKLFLSGAISYISDRRTLGGGFTGSALWSDFTLTTMHLTSQFDLQAGLRNALNERYYDPAGLAVDRIEADGRLAYLKLIWHSRE